MLKKIGRDDVQLGMFIQRFEGSWVDHPFWKASFLLKQKNDLQRIQESAVHAVWIDTARGIDCIEPIDAKPIVPSVPYALEADTVTNSKGSKIIGCDRELARAAKVLTHAKQEVARLFNDARLGKAISMGDAEAVVEQVSGSVLRHPTTLISLARLRSADEYTFVHSVSVCALMTAVARQLNLTAGEVRAAGTAGLLHDVGKMLVPLKILNKPGKLTDEEFLIMKSHAKQGVALLQQWQASAESVDVCLHHHEKYDGSGYPDGLAGNEISLLSRIAAVCDVYDAISSARPYKQAWSPAESIRKMADWKGHFDPNVFQAFIKTLGIYPIGSLVRLNNDQLAVVVDQHPDNLLTPKIRIFFSARSRTPLPQRLLDLARAPGGEKIVCRENPENWGFRNLEKLWQQEQERG